MQNYDDTNRKPSLFVHKTVHILQTAGKQYSTLQSEYYAIPFFRTSLSLECLLIHP